MAGHDPRIRHYRRQDAADRHRYLEQDPRDPRRAEAALFLPLGRFPTVEDELDILRRKAPEAGAALGEQVVRFVQRLRGANLFKAPGVAETIDWAQALVELDCVAIDPAQADSTMGVLLKYQDDIARISGSEAARILTEVQMEMSGYKAG